MYYAFDRAVHGLACSYNPRLPLSWSLDFNVNPMCSVIAQVESLAEPGWTGRRVEIVHVLDEIVLRDSNTRAACDEFAKRCQQITGQQHPQLQVSLYGDASGNSRKTSGTTDWNTVREWFKLRPWFETYYRVPAANPEVKNRVNAVNGILRNFQGEVRMYVDPRCKELTRDLEQVAWLVDKHGNTLDEIAKTDPNRTHTSDALGYFIEKQFSLAIVGGPRSGPAPL